MSSESEAAVKNETNLPLKSLGKYLIERKLGQGGMGTVYLAKHIDLKKMIALKVLPQDKAKNPILVKRFKAEAQAAAQLEHPNIVAVYDTGEADGYLYIAMEYVDGIDLFEQVKRRGVIPVKRSIEIIKQVAAGLQHAFEQNIVHRDIKPSNLLLRRDGVVKVTDLGLARSIDDTLETNITRAGTTVGTVDYMAPEQARSSKSADIRSDIYSLGCTWYQMLTGEPPFSEGSLTNKLQAHAIKPLPDPREKNENIPEGLIAILQRMTAKKPEDRYQSPAELLDDLEHSKLTKAAFSNEIFSDLSDDDVSAVVDLPDKEVENDEESPADPSLRSRKRSRVFDDSVEIPSEPTRRKAKRREEDEADSRSRKQPRARDGDASPVDDAEPLKPRRKPTQKSGRDERDYDDDYDDEESYDEESPRGKTRSRETDESDEIESDQYHRKASRRDEDESDEPVRRKQRPRDGATSPLDDTQSLKSRKKHSQKGQDEEPVEEPQSTNRSSRRLNSESDEIESEDPSSSKRKRTSQADSDVKTPSLKPSVTSSAKDASDKKAVKNGPKPLPPKRQAIVEQTGEQPKLNIELLRSIGIIIGLMTVIGGSGYLVYRWNNQIDAVQNPIAIATATPAEVPLVAPVKSQSEPKESPSVTVNVVEPAKPGVSERERTTPEYDISKQPLPGWATAEASEPRDLPIFTVGPGATTASHFSNLDEALKAAEKTGGFVRLMGNGPFLFSSMEIGSGKKLFITAASPQDQPLIIFKPNDAGEISGLVVENGVLELRGLHFAVDRAAGSVMSPSRLITVEDGQLFVRKCSFTTTGKENAATTALAFLSKQDSQGGTGLEAQVLLDRVTVRGNGLTGLLVDRAIAETVIQDSLFVTGTAPAIEMNGHLAAQLSEAPTLKPRRTLRVIRSTLCARKQAIELAADGSSKPPWTAILFQDSICSAEGSGNTAVLVSATRWPSVTSTTTGWMTNLTWTSVSSLYLGFDRLLDLDKSSFKVPGLDNWQRVWGKKFESIQFQPIIWQENLIPELSAALPQDFDSSKLPYGEVKTSKGRFPGCVISQLNVPGAISPDRLFALSRRPKLPAAVQKTGDAKSTRKIDLAKEDLGVVINRNDWQNGAVFEVSGSGIKFMSPAKIVGKTLHITFRQGDGAPLKLQPKVSDQKTTVENAGLFNVDNGTLDLQSGTIEAAQTGKGSAPAWLISAKNANVILRGCQLNGPLQIDLDHYQGLIQWATSGEFQPTDGSDPPFLVINDSMLMSNGLGIHSNCSRGNIFVRNSILAIRGFGIDLLPSVIDSRYSPVVDLEHVTFSTTKAAIRVEAAAATEIASSPVRMFVNYCAVCPPLEFKAGEAADSAVLECVGPVREQKLVEWWGASNGFAKDVKALLRQSNGNLIHTASGWLSEWGDSNEYRLLTGPKGVNLSNNLPTKWVNLKVTSFVLDPNSPGATWADGGRPVGADIRFVEDAIMAKKPVMDGKPSSTNKPSQPGSSPTMSGKKNVGF